MTTHAETAKPPRPRRDLASRYRRHGETILIELKLSDVMQLFNSLDPSPFHEKDLDDDAAEYILGTAREFSLKTPLRLSIYLPAEAIGKDTADTVTHAIHNFFDYRELVAARDLRELLRRGRTSLIIGLVFLSLCLFARELVGNLVVGTLTEFLREGLLISGWVAMWRPIQIFLYEWWPVRNLRRLNDKLSHLKIDVKPLE
jgi:hypothetical protein